MSGLLELFVCEYIIDDSSVDLHFYDKSCAIQYSTYCIQHGTIHQLLLPDVFVFFQLE